MANEHLNPEPGKNENAATPWRDMDQHKVHSGEVIRQVGESFQYQNWGPVSAGSVTVLNVPDGRNTVTVLQFITEEADSSARKAATQDGLMRAISTQQSGNRAERRRLQKEGAGAENNTTMQMHFDQGAYEIVLLTHMIKAWTFREEGTNQIIPITQNAIATLPLHTRDWLMGAIDDMNPKYDEVQPKEEDEDPEFSRSGHRTSPLGGRTIASS